MKRKQFGLILLSLLIPLLISFSPAICIFSTTELRISAVQAQTPSPTSSPTPTPLPVVPSTEVEADPLSLPLSESDYVDPQGRFRVGILQGYNVGSTASWPLIESPDGDLAYTVVVRVRESDREIASASLAQIAIETFERGEGFQPGTYQIISPNEISLPWTGNLRTVSSIQPIQGKIRARQAGQRLFLVLVSATESAFQEVDPAIVTVADSLVGL